MRSLFPLLYVVIFQLCFVQPAFSFDYTEVKEKRAHDDAKELLTEFIKDMNSKLSQNGNTEKVSLGKINVYSDFFGELGFRTVGLLGIDSYALSVEYTVILESSGQEIIDTLAIHYSDYESVSNDIQGQYTKDKKDYLVALREGRFGNGQLAAPNYPKYIQNLLRF